MIVAGIDYSMTSPSITIFDTTKELKFENLEIYNRVKTKKCQGDYGNVHIEAHQEFESPEERFKNLADWSIGILTKHNVEKVWLEGYAMGSTAGLIFQIAENTSVLKQRLYGAAIPFETPPPAQIKKAFHGKGNAKKPDMVEVFDRMFGVDLAAMIDCPKAGAPENDMVDSVAIMLMHRL